jgi:hypothetical protein
MNEEGKKRKKKGGSWVKKKEYPQQPELQGLFCLVCKGTVFFANERWHHSQPITTRRVWAKTLGVFKVYHVQVAL